MITEVHQKFTEIFNKVKATSLLSQRPYDCTINLLQGTSPPFNRIYPLSLTEPQAIEEYVQEALQQGHIHPWLHLPQQAFLRGEEKRGLRPCIKICHSIYIQYILDDILIYSSSLENHITHVKKGLFSAPRKSTLCQDWKLWVSCYSDFLPRPCYQFRQSCYECKHGDSSKQWAHTHYGEQAPRFWASYMWSYKGIQFCHHPNHGSAKGSQGSEVESVNVMKKHSPTWRPTSLQLPCSSILIPRSPLL